MMPCCVIGALFMVQLLAFGRWFSRVILRKPVTEDEGHYWKPEKSGIAVHAKSFLANKRKAVILLAGLCIQIVVGIVVYNLGGFHFIANLFEMLK